LRVAAEQRGLLHGWCRRLAKAVSWCYISRIDIVEREAGLLLPTEETLLRF
jgi:hypothetical protein